MNGPYNFISTVKVVEEYVFLSGVKHDYEGAKTACEEQGLELAMPKSQTEMDQLETFIAGQAVDGNHMYIGIDDSDQDGVYTVSTLEIRTLYFR